MKCDKPCEVFSRVVGYHRPTFNWNRGKLAEFTDRKEFNNYIEKNIRYDKKRGEL